MDFAKEALLIFLPLPEDVIEISLPNEDIFKADFRVVSADYHFFANPENRLEVTINLGRQKVQFADWIYALKSKASSFINNKLSKIR